MATLLLLMLTLSVVAAVVLFTAVVLWRSLVRWDKGMLRAYAEIAWRSLFPARSLGWATIERRILSRMRRCVTISAGGVSVTPTEFVVGLAPADLASMQGVRSFVETDLSNSLASEARRHGWRCARPPTVIIVADHAAQSGFPLVHSTFAADTYAAGSAKRNSERVPTEPLSRSLTEPLPRSLTMVESLAAAATEPWAVIELASMDAAHPDIDLSDRSGTVLVGRGAGCDVSMDAPTVSDQHALLRPTEVGWEVEDLGSRNGTFRNGQRLTVAATLQHGDYISFSQNGPRFRYTKLDRSLPVRTKRGRR